MNWENADEIPCRSSGRGRVRMRLSNPGGGRGQNKRPVLGRFPPALTRQQFEALPPTAMIEVDGKQISKQEFLTRQTNTLKQATKQMEDMRSRAATEFEARRKAFLDREKTSLDEANKKFQAEIDRFISADAAAHGPNWDARKKQAAALLKDAAAADAPERSRLEKQAADLLAPASPQP
jgi:hypothetical protein